MNEAIATSVISRCRLSNMEKILQRWGRCSHTEVKWLLEKRPTKAQIVKKLCQIIQQNDLNQEILGDLELSYIQLHPRCKQWKAYHMKGSRLQLGMDPRSLNSRLVKHLKLTWKDGQVHGNMSLFAGAVWLRLHLDVSRAHSKKVQPPRTAGYRQHHSVFVVTFKHSPYIIISSAGQKLTKTVCEALKHVLSADTLTIQLTGRHVASLADLVHGHHHKALSTKYRDKESAENSLCSGQKRKHSDLDEVCPLEGVSDENKIEKRLRRDYLKENFGGQPQPELETVTYKFSSDFRGKAGLKCQSSVELRGQSVMDGLCQAVRSGTLRWPLPKHMSAITVRASNSFVLEGKKKS